MILLPTRRHIDEAVFNQIGSVNMGGKFWVQFLLTFEKQMQGEKAKIEMCTKSALPTY